MNKAGRAKKSVCSLGFTALVMCSAVQADDCVRSTPSPVFAAARKDVQAHIFTLKSDHEAVERFKLAPGMQVKVEHGGCEYFVTKIRFEAPELFAKTYTDAMAYETAASLLRTLNNARPEVGFDLGLASETLLAEARRKRTPKLDHELSIQGDGVPPLQARIVIDAAGRARSLGYLEVTLFRGPL